MGKPLEHLRHWPGLFVREGDRIVPAPEEDERLARTYPDWPDKGPVYGGRRITVMAKKDAYSVGEEVRVIHVFEAIEPGHRVYVMGPKPVQGEYVDEKLATGPPPTGGDPLVPLNYNGRVLPSPAVDYNYEITSYKFSEPGTHRILWKIGPLRSNVLKVTVLHR